ncbi:Rhophilin, Rho GTPase binding protein [Ascosphaera atra]|nr:Rhophilin, Rho GTPase binding protein [Ascosphaera atra]
MTSYELTLSDALKKYISAKYDQHPEMFTDDLLIIDRLRKEAIAVQEAHGSGVTKLLAYIAQLKWIGGKFPVDVSISG